MGQLHDNLQSNSPRAKACWMGPGGMAQCRRLYVDTDLRGCCSCNWAQTSTHQQEHSTAQVWVPPTCPHLCLAATSPQLLQAANGRSPVGHHIETALHDALQHIRDDRLRPASPSPCLPSPGLLPQNDIGCTYRRHSQTEPWELCRWDPGPQQWASHQHQ